MGDRPKSEALVLHTSVEGAVPSSPTNLPIKFNGEPYGEGR